jgi:transcriptional regulator with XRE-family HTH domain
MDSVIKEMGERLRGMREIMNISPGEMAAATGVSEAEYLALEEGQRDYSFSFLYKAAQRFGIDLTELIAGESPRLTGYFLNRKGQGLPIERRRGFRYLNLASNFRGRVAEPFLVHAPYEEGNEHSAIVQSTHEGQEMDYILSGTLRVQIGPHQEIMQAGDTIYYDSGRPHGMVATGGKECQFLAVVINTESKNREDL